MQGVVLAHMLTAATLMVGKHWKLEKDVSIKERVEKIRYVCLINKLTAIMRYRPGNSNALTTYCSEWSCFFKPRYNRTNEMIREHILSLM